MWRRDFVLRLEERIFYEKVGDIVVGKDQRWMFRCLLYDGCITVIKISSFNSKSFVLLKFYLTRFKSSRVFHTSYVSGLHDCRTWEIRNCSRLCYHNQVLCLDTGCVDEFSSEQETGEKKINSEIWNREPACCPTHARLTVFTHLSVRSSVYLTVCVCLIYYRQK